MTSRDIDSWAAPIDRLETAPGQAPLDTVRGRRPVGALQGFGQLWHKTFRVTIRPQTESGEADAHAVIAYWKAHFPELWPRRNTFYPPAAGIAPNGVALLSLGVMPGIAVSTGIVVIYADDERFTYMTADGHPLAGWVTFSATDTPAGVVAEIDILTRGRNVLAELALVFGGHRQENDNWRSTLRSLAARLGTPDAPIETELVRLDGRRQWRLAANLRHDAGLRSALFCATAPLRWARSRTAWRGGK